MVSLASIQRRAIATVFAMCALAPSAYGWMVGVSVPIKNEYEEFVNRRARLLLMARWGAGMAGVGKGIVDAENWGGSSNVIGAGNWWHAADVLRTAGTVMTVGALLYGVGRGDFSWGEATRYGIGCALHADLVFKMTYHGIRYGSPIDLKPEHNQGMIQYPWFGGDQKINATHWSHAALHRSVLYFGGGWLKRNVEQGHDLLWPVFGR